MSVEIRVNNVNRYAHLKNSSLIPVAFRNRDWTAVFKDISLRFGKKIPAAPATNQSIVIGVDGSYHYLGYITRSRFEPDRDEWIVEATHYLKKLEKHRINKSTLHSTLNKTADFSAGNIFYAEPDNDRIVTATEHGLADGDAIQFKNENGELPGPLRDDKYYYVRVVDAYTLKLYETHSDYIIPEPPVNIQDYGSGEHFWAYADFGKYIGQVNAADQLAATTIKWLVEKMFEKIGVVLNTSQIDDVIFHKFDISSVTYEWKWNQIYIDENMLYNLNQHVAITPNNITPGSKYEENEINFLEFILDLFGKLGIAIKFTGSHTNIEFSLFSQKRNATGVIQPNNEDEFNVDDSDQVKYVDETLLDDQGGYSHSRTYNDNRALYASQDEQELTEYNFTRVNAGRTRISWINNLRFLLKDQTVNDYSPGQLLDPNTFGHEFYNIAFYSAIVNQTNSLLNHYREEIECRDTYLSQAVWTVKELYLDIPRRRIKIIQEQNLMASG